MSELLRRKAVADAAFMEFVGKPLAWGEVDCVHLADFALTKFGYASQLSEIGTYKNYRGARRVMKKAGITGFEAVLDQVLEPIAPALARSGDIIGVEGYVENENDAPWLSLGVCVDDRFLGFNGQGVCDHAPLLKVAKYAWRCKFQD